MFTRVTLLLSATSQQKLHLFVISQPSRGFCLECLANVCSYYQTDIKVRLYRNGKVHSD